MIKLRLYFPPQRRIVVYNIFNISLKILIKLQTKLALNVEWHGTILKLSEKHACVHHFTKVTFKQQRLAIIFNVCI